MLISEITKDLPNSKYRKMIDKAFFDEKNEEEKRETIYFTIERKPYTVPISMKRPNATKEEVLKEFPDAKILDSVASFTPEEAKAIGEAAGVDFDKIDLDQFRMGLEVELEHKDLTDGDPGMTAKIVLAHLKEIPDYYTRLKKMESGAEVKDTGPKEKIVFEQNGFKIKESDYGDGKSEFSIIFPNGQIIENMWTNLSDVKRNLLNDYMKTHDGGEGSGVKGHQTLRQKLQEKMKKKVPNKKLGMESKEEAFKRLQNMGISELTKIAESHGSEKDPSFVGAAPGKNLKKKLIDYILSKN